MSHLDLLSESERCLNHLMYVIIYYYCCFKLLCYNSILDYCTSCGSCGEGDKRAVNKNSWFTFRSGRLTASVIKTAARTNHAMTSSSLVKRICYPEVS